MSRLEDQDDTLVISDDTQGDVLRGWLVLLDDMGKPRRSFELIKPVTRIGRDSNNDVILNDKTVSRVHCFIEIIEDEITIVEEDAVNGVYLNDYPRARGTLEDGMVVRLGKIFLCVKLI